MPAVYQILRLVDDLLHRLHIPSPVCDARERAEWKVHGLPPDF